MQKETKIVYYPWKLWAAIGVVIMFLVVLSLALGHLMISIYKPTPVFREVLCLIEPQKVITFRGQATTPKKLQVNGSDVYQFSTFENGKLSIRQVPGECFHQ